MKKRLARNGKRLVADALFWARRTFVEKSLDPRRDSILISWATYSPWLQDADFQAVHEVVAPNTLVDITRCYELWHLLGQTCDLAGDVLEVGTWRGGTGALLAARARDLGLAAEIHLCDTFTGVVKTSGADKSYAGGEHADTSEAVVRELCGRLGLKNVRILAGVFPDDTAARIADRRFRLCHVDVDAYESGRDVLAWVWERLVPGGVVVFDDFGFPSTVGIARLVHEWEPRSDLVSVQNLNGHAIFVKTGSGAESGPGAASHRSPPGAET